MYGVDTSEIWRNHLTAAPAVTTIYDKPHGFSYKTIPGASLAGSAHSALKTIAGNIL
jgi:hypothetical protein